MCWRADPITVRPPTRVLRHTPSMTRTRRWVSVSAGLTSLTLLLAAAGGCARSRGQDGSDSATSCVSPLIFEGRRYLWVPTQNGYVEPGSELGSGTYEPCADGDDSDLKPSTEAVFVLPEVASEEAIVVTDANGRHGTVYRAHEEPEGGWDPDLQVWLDRAEVKTG